MFLGDFFSALFCKRLSNTFCRALLEFRSSLENIFPYSTDAVVNNFPSILKRVIKSCENLDKSILNVLKIQKNLIQNDIYAQMMSQSFMSIFCDCGTCLWLFFWNPLKYKYFEILIDYITLLKINLLEFENHSHQFWEIRLNGKKVLIYP